MSSLETTKLLQSLVDAIADAVADRLLPDLLQRDEAKQEQPSELDVHGVAELLNCSVPTIERRVKAGEIPSYKVSRLRRYNRDAVLAAVQKNGGKA